MEVSEKTTLELLKIADKYSRSFDINELKINIQIVLELYQKTFDQVSS